MVWPYETNEKNDHQLVPEVCDSVGSHRLTNHLLRSIIGSILLGIDKFWFQYELAVMLILTKSL